MLFAPPICLPGRAIRDDAIHYGLEGLRLGRLYEMIPKSGSHRLVPIRLLSPACERDKMRLLSPRPFLHLPCRLVAVEQRHADIHEHELRGEIIACCKRLDSVVHRAHFVSFESEQHCQGVRRIAIVISNEDAQSSGG